MTIPYPERHREPVEGVTVERDVTLTVRDGTQLAVDVYRPSDLGEGPFPALYAASPYQKDIAGLPSVAMYPFRETGPIEWYVRRGYVYVHGDIRGTGKSGGEWRMHSRQEQEDLCDTIEWIATQPWSNGRVGMIGQSYYGFVQWQAAAQKPPHLVCIAPYDALVDPYRDRAFHGGIPSSGYLTLWSFMIRGNHALGPRGPESLDRLVVDPAHALLEHPTDDEFWRERAAYWRLDDVDIPVFSIGNWGKNSLHLRGNILGYETVRGPKRLRVQAGARSAGMNVARALADFESVAFHEQVLAPWYDHWLKGEDNGVLDEPAVQLYVSGIDEYRSFDEWPPPTEVRRFHLAAGPAGAIDSLNDGALTESDPPHDGGATSYAYPDERWAIGTAALDERGAPDPAAAILTFASTPLERDLEVVGQVALVLYASSDQVDTDFVVRLTDQPPNSTRGAIVSRGWLKASHRSIDTERSTPLRPFHDHRRPEPLEPGRVYRFEIELMPLAHVFRRGHRLRLELANGDSSVTDGIFTHFYGLKLGVDTIHHDAEHPSHLLLPVNERNEE